VYTYLRYAWDTGKSARNLMVRGFDFEFATLIFGGFTLERADVRREYGERRMVAIGNAQGIMLTVVYTDRSRQHRRWSAGSFLRDGATAMSAKRTSRQSKVAETPLRGRADLARLRRQTEQEIVATSPADLANLPADFWVRARLTPPIGKQAISLRVDADVLTWFRKQGPRYQSRMNAVLRAYMQHESGKA
jgi:uncharacterized protein